MTEPLLAKDLPRATRDSIVVQLLFDGKPLLSKKRAKISCYDYARSKWINCHIQPIEGMQRYAMARPAVGSYRMHIGIDEDESNPDSYAGDYAAIQPFEIRPDGPQSLLIDVPLVIHLRTPVDNRRSLEGAFAACERDPRYVIPFLEFDRKASVALAWDPVVEGAEYAVSIIRTRCSPYERLETVVSDRITASRITLALPPNEDGEHYQFLVDGFKDGRPVGVLHIHDAGTHGWDYRFRVAVEAPNRKIAVVASLGTVFLFFLVSLAYMLLNGNRSLAVASLVVLAVSGWLGYQAYASYREDHRLSQQRLLESEETAAQLEESYRRLFVDEWTLMAPPPAWWDDISPPDYEIDNVGELLSAWQSGFGNGDTRLDRERQFFKGAYLAIVEHPGDRDLTSAAIDLMSFIGRDYPQRQQMLEFAVKHFFDLDRRTDNCADCMVGDRTNSFVEDLSQIYLRNGRYDEAIALIERFKAQRLADVSDYAWAGTVRLLGEAYWASGQREQAVASMASVDSSGSEHPDHPNFERLRDTLEAYRTELSSRSRRSRERDPS